MCARYARLLELSAIAMLACAARCGAPTARHAAASPVAAESSRQLAPEHGVSGTFSIVAVDPESGVCGAAVASKYPAVGQVVPYARADVGAFCTQHWHEPKWGERALDLLAAGKLPEEVLGELLRDDPRRDKRQLAIIDMKGRAANRNPADADPSGVYWGAMSGRYYACQGNTLTGRAVVVAMATAYEETRGSLADRLMAALLAADCAGGDHRGRLAAGIRVAQHGVEGYWLELQVDQNDNAVAELARKYAELDHEAKGDWEGGKRPFHDPCPDRRQASADSPAERWEADIRRFETADRAAAPAPAGILFVGSSSIRLWNVAESFPSRHVINRGFGGSHIADCVRYADRIVWPYQPRTVVFYAGDNDIAAGKSPARVLEDFRAFVNKVQEALPDTRIVFVSIKPSIQRWALVEKIRGANEKIRDYARSDKRLAFADVYTPMLGPDGRPRPELFQKDGLHLNAEGYRLWTSVLDPWLRAE